MHATLTPTLTLSPTIPTHLIGLTVISPLLHAQADNTPAAVVYCLVLTAKLVKDLTEKTGYNIYTHSYSKYLLP